MNAAVLVILAGCPAGGVSAQQAGDPAAGKKLSMQCRTCHGSDGVATMPVAPNIGGESAAYLAKQLRAFRDGSRENEMMTVVSRPLTDQQITDVAAYFASFHAAGTAPEGRSAPEACVTCHGADGIAIIAEAPNLAGETAMYIDTQLKAFRAGKRSDEIMQGVTSGLSDDQIRDLADYFAATRLTVTAGQ